MFKLLLKKVTEQMSKIKTAIIGMGKMGKIRYNAMIRHGGYEIHSVCDLTKDGLERYSKKVFDDWRECIIQPEVEAVCVCTFNAYIKDIVCYALNNNKHVFSEKPPGRSLNETVLMKEAFKKNNRILKFGFNHRYHGSIIEAKALIDSGLIGDIVCARGVYGKAGSLGFDQEWRNDISLSGGGILIDQGIHMLDLLCYFVGDFKNIKSNVNQLVWKEMNTEDSVFAILETSEGKVASLHSSAVQWKHKFDLDLICSNGYIALNGILSSTQSYGEERMTYYRKDLATRSGKLGRPLEHNFTFDYDDSWDMEMKEFYDAINGCGVIIHGTIDQAVYVMSLVEKIYGLA